MMPRSTPLTATGQSAVVACSAHRPELASHGALPETDATLKLPLTALSTPVSVRLEIMLLPALFHVSSTPALLRIYLLFPAPPLSLMLTENAPPVELLLNPPTQPTGPKCCVAPIKVALWSARRTKAGIGAPDVPTRTQTAPLASTPTPAQLPLPLS